MNHQAETLKLALDFISRLKFADAEPEPERVMEAIKKALDRVDPAPVAKNEGGRITWLVDDWPANCLLYAEPPSWTPVEIGVDVTSEGTHVVGMYVLMPDVVRHVFYSQFHPTPQRQWVGLTNDERWSLWDFYWENDLLSLFELLGIVEAKLKQKNGFAEEKNT